MSNRKYIIILKFLVICLSISYIVSVICYSPNILSEFDISYKSDDIDKQKVKYLYISLIVVSVLNCFVGIVGAFLQIYTITMISSVIKILIFLLIFAQLIPQPIIITVINGFMTLFSFVFAFYLWTESQRKIELSILLTEESI